MSPFSEVMCTNTAFHRHYYGHWWHFFIFLCYGEVWEESLVSRTSIGYLVSNLGYSLGDLVFFFYLPCLGVLGNGDIHHTHLYFILL